MTTTGTVQGFDATGANVAHLPAGPYVIVAGYVTGLGGVPWTAADWAAHPGAVRIDQSPVNTPADETADILDFENGAATVADIAPWAHAALTAYFNGVRPGQRAPAIYASASQVTTVVNALIAGLSPALRFGIVTDFCGVLVQSGRPVLR